MNFPHPPTLPERPWQGPNNEMARNSIFGKYFTDEEWKFVESMPADCMYPARLMPRDCRGPRLEALQYVASLQLNVRSQIAWTRVLLLTQWVVGALFSGDSPNGVEGVINELPLKGAAMMDEAPEGAFFTQILLPDGPVNVAAGRIPFAAHSLQQLTTAIIGVADMPGCPSVVGKLLRWAYLIFKRIEVQAELPVFGMMTSITEHRNIALHASEVHAAAVTYSNEEWAATLAECGLFPHDVERFFTRETSTWPAPGGIDDFDIMRAPFTACGVHVVLVSPTTLLTALHHHLMDVLQESPVSGDFVVACAKQVQDDIVLSLRGFGLRGELSPLGYVRAEMDEGSVLVCVPVVDEKAPFASLSGVASGGDLAAIGQQIISTERPKDILLLGVRSMLPPPPGCMIPAALNRELLAEPIVIDNVTLQLMADVVGHDPLFFFNYARDYELHRRTHVQIPRYEAPELMAHYYVHEGFPPPGSPPNFTLVSVIGASFWHRRSEELVKRRWFKDPSDGDWIRCISHPAEQSLGIWRTEGPDARLVLRRLGPRC